VKTTPVTSADLARSVIAVPPLARNQDLSLNRDANAALIRHLETAGIRSIMYGGNANFYHVPVSDYQATLEMLAELAGPETWVLPSAGPDYGRLIDQAGILRNLPFPAAMALPMSFPFTDAGLATGIRHFTDKLGKPAVVYIKATDYIHPDTIAKLVEERRVAAVKYAAVRPDPADDAYLEAVAKVVPRSLLVSGIGERPAIVHLRDFGLISFTSGSVCVAPRSSMKLLTLLGEKRYAEAEQVRAMFMPLEDCRDSISPIRVLHDAVTLAGIADMGPMLPLLTGLDQAERDRVGGVAKALRAADLKM
jgi:dihydrodipicolinate synthase/N-acetylneuraminate lyase